MMVGRHGKPAAGMVVWAASWVLIYKTQTRSGDGEHWECCKALKPQSPAQWWTPSRTQALPRPPPPTGDQGWNMGASCVTFSFKPPHPPWQSNISLKPGAQTNLSSPKFCHVFWWPQQESAKTLSHVKCLSHPRAGPATLYLSLQWYCSLLSSYPGCSIGKFHGPDLSSTIFISCCERLKAKTVSIRWIWY